MDMWRYVASFLAYQLFWHTLMKFSKEFFPNDDLKIETIQKKGGKKRTIKH